VRAISRWRALVFVALGVLGGCERHAPAPAPATPQPTATVAAPVEPVALTAPSGADGGDLDLHLHWRAARVHQVLPAADERWRFRQYSDLVVRDGEAHRALLLLPSSDGAASRASFEVTVPVESDCELVAWVALEAGVAAKSDGVDFGVALAAADTDPDAAPITFTRLPGGDPRAGWREVRIDLADRRGTTLWVILAAREERNRDGDWLLWGDPRVRLKDRADEVVLDLTRADSAARRPRRAPWSETNVFKPYALFRHERVSSAAVRWMARALPWLDSVRLFSALGANWGPTLERDDDAQTGKNPTMDNRWETDLAREYEFFRDAPGASAAPIAERFEWTSFDRLLDALGDSVLALHLNLAGAPEAFTGHRGHYATYHFNEMPVVDEAGWRSYVAALFAHLASRPWFGRAELSFFNEPNCRWTQADGTVLKFGYQGDADEYARQYLWTWQAMKPYVRPGQIHLGPFVAEPDRDNPITNNLGAFLQALHRTFVAAGEPLPPWSAFAFNVYDTPQLTLDGLAATKIAYVREMLDAEFPGLDLPLRFDEVGLHPVIASVFEASGAGALDATRWASAWNAEMLALLLDQDIQRASPWSSVFLRRTFAPYFFASVVAHAIDYRVAAEGELVLERSGGAVAAPASLYVRLASRHGDRIGALWSGSADARTWRVALWHFPRFATSDARLASETDVHRVTVRFPSSPPGRWRVRVTAPDPFPVLGRGQGDAARERHMVVHEVPGAPSLDVRELTVAGHVHFELHAGDVLLVEAEALDAPGSGAAPPQRAAQLDAQHARDQHQRRERHENEPRREPAQQRPGTRLAAHVMRQ
jgi:hypothetical protein